MTRQQIATVLGVHINRIHSAFELAIKEHAELDLYEPSKNNIKNKGIDYTLEQVLLAMSYYRDGKGASVLERAMITDEFSMRPVEKIKAKGIEGTEEFLERVKRYPKLHCCSTCAYCTKSAMRNRKPVMKPYCKLWERFLHRINANPYRDYCRQWEYSGKEPLIFYTADSPSNVDIYGNTKNEVMGVDISKFSSKVDGTGRLVTDVGFSDDVLESF